MNSRRRFCWLRAQAKIILILILCYQGSACALRKPELIDSTPVGKVKKTSNISNLSQTATREKTPAEAQIAAQTETIDKNKPIISEDIPVILERDIVRSSRNGNRKSAFAKSDFSRGQSEGQPKVSNLSSEPLTQDRVKNPGHSSNVESKRPSAKNYTGKPISLDFQDADIRSVLRIIGEVSNHNLVIDPDVKGRVTVTLQNPVPWDQAIDIILKTNQLSMRMEGNIMRVGTQKTFMQEEDAILKAIQAKQMTEQAQKISRPLKTEFITVNYAQASKLKEQITPMLSDSKGLLEPSSIIVDERTNSLIIKDLPENILRLKEVLANLDRETPQVMIETRIVEMKKSYLKELGVRWGGGYKKQTNYRFPRTIGIAGIRGGDYAVDLPNTKSSFGGVGVNLGHINDLVQLNLELDSMESQGKGRIISNPRIATLDNERAEIKCGRKIPYPSVDKDGQQSTQFIDAAIKLSVTPHITPNNYITMEIEADKSEPSSPEVNGVPSISTRSATTKLIVKDGDTTVIGGLYQRTENHDERKVPWFSNIPGLGWLFRSNLQEESYDELLIFITPRIVGKK